jgi:hypothetical protein
VRLYAQPVPPSDDVIVREVGAYAKARLPMAREHAAVAAAPAEASGGGPGSGIIEID